MWLSSFLDCADLDNLLIIMMMVILLMLIITIINMMMLVKIGNPPQT